MNARSQPQKTVRARKFAGGRDAGGFPHRPDWDSAAAIRFDHDWQGKNADPRRQTEVRLLWSTDELYVRFSCRYRTLTVFQDSDTNGRRDQLWDRDVAEMFLQPEPAESRRYWEFEIAPNGMWIDLDISPAGRRDPQIAMRSQVTRYEGHQEWTAEIALPIRQLARQFDPTTNWRVNFFRVEGASEPRFYSAWSPTNTPQPNFHVPEAFGLLTFD